MQTTRIAHGHLATVNSHPALGFQRLLRFGHPLRVFHGSAVGAALTVLLGKHGYDLFVGVVRETTAYLLATAAVCLGGQIFAVALNPPDGKLAQGERRRFL
jgi:hypothetical protein